MALTELTLENFIKHPIAVVAVLAVGGMTYLYTSLVDAHEAQLDVIEASCVERIEDHKERIESLESTITKYEEKLDQINAKLLECLGTQN
jgi:septal ring factor EnvC (AmiA/AmiB activator)